MPRARVALIDANVVLRYLLDDDPDQSPRARVFVKRLESGGAAVRLEDVTIAEVVWVLEKGFKVPRNVIARQLAAFVGIRGVLCRVRRVVAEALALFAGTNCDIAACLLAAHARSSKGIVRSFDEDFNKLGCKWERPA